jgi:8-oxo-dGTP diphosphatase
VHWLDGRIRYHFVIVDYLCRASEGQARAGDDADDVAWATADELDQYRVNPHAAAVIRKGLEMARRY